MRGAYWLITLAGLHAVIYRERSVWVTVLLVIMIASGTLSCFFADRRNSAKRRTRPPGS